MSGYSRCPAECGFTRDYLKSFARRGCSLGRATRSKSNRLRVDLDAVRMSSIRIGRVAMRGIFQCARFVLMISQILGIGGIAVSGRVLSLPPTWIRHRMSNQFRYLRLLVTSVAQRRWETVALEDCGQFVNGDLYLFCHFALMFSGIAQGGAPRQAPPPRR